MLQLALFFTGYSDLSRMRDGRIGIVCQHGDLEDPSRKSDRYDKVVFTFVQLRQIQALVP
jgi:hypothetical protein